MKDKPLFISNTPLRIGGGLYQLFFSLSKKFFVRRLQAIRRKRAATTREASPPRAAAVADETDARRGPSPDGIGRGRIDSAAVSEYNAPSPGQANESRRSSLSRELRKSTPFRGPDQNRLPTHLGNTALVLRRNDGGGRRRRFSKALSLPGRKGEDVAPEEPPSGPGGFSGSGRGSEGDARPPPEEAPWPRPGGILPALAGWPLKRTAWIVCFFASGWLVSR